MNTNTYVLEQDREKKNKRRGLIIAFWLHLALLVMGLFPFLSNLQSPPEPETQTAVLIDFTDFKPASKEGAKPKTKSKAKKKKKAAKKSTPKVKPIPKPEPKPLPVPIAKPKPVLTTPEPNPPIETQPEPVEVPEAPVDVPEPEDKAPQAPVEMDADEAEADDSDAEEAASEAASDSGAESGNGTGETGSGKFHTGNNNGETAGEGIFSRRVIYRADVKKITEEEGKIVVELCINREGRVVYAKADKPASTIDDNNVIRKAVQLTTKYKFERDYTAPNKQCGKMTYIFEIEEE